MRLSLGEIQSAMCRPPLIPRRANPLFAFAAWIDNNLSSSFHGRKQGS
jgi:hypothetical protein